MTRPQQRLGIVSSGRRNLQRASKDCVRADKDCARAELIAKHRDEQRTAGPIRRLVLAWRIRQELRRVQDDVAPPDALYARQRRGM